MLENKFKTELVKEIKTRLPDCIVLHPDPNEIQGMNDLIILNNDKWAGLEGKKSKTASKRPNQDYYVNKLNEMSFSRFIYPENKEEVLDELYKALEP